jgi:uncharacterized protein (DUF1499 family)
MNRTAEPHPVTTTHRWTRRIGGLGLIAGIVAVLAMLLPGPIYRIGVLGLKAAFSGVTLGFGLGLLATLLGLIALLLAIFGRPRRYLVRPLIAIVLGMIAFVPPLMFMRQAKSVPPIHDISTDTAQPPEFQALLAQRADAPNSAVYGGAEVAAQQHAAYPDIQSLQFDALPAKTFKAALSAAQSMGWTIAAQLPDEGRIEATATTFWFGFKDDVVIRLRPDGTGTRVDIRSESRVGGSDVGANAARIRKFSGKLRETLGAHSRS